MVARIHSASDALIEATSNLATARAMVLSGMVERGREKLNAGAVEKYEQARATFDAVALLG